MKCKDDIDQFEEKKYCWYADASSGNFDDFFMIINFDDDALMQFLQGEKANASESASEWGDDSD